VSGIEIMSGLKLQIKGVNRDVKDKVFSISESFVIGRSPQCDLFITDLQASRRHTRFFRDQTGALLVEDLKSSNGTFFNGKRLTDAKFVNAGDIVRLGSTEFAIEHPKLAAATVVTGGFSTTHYKR